MSDFALHPLLQKDAIFLADLPLCSLLLSNDKQYPWFILVPRINNVKDIYQLEWSDQQQFLNESSMLCELLMQYYQGEKMNVAALGNICPQLHVHHIVRFNSDAVWPAPVWGAKPALPYLEGEISLIKEKLLPLIQSVIK